MAVRKLEAIPEHLRQLAEEVPAIVVIGQNAYEMPVLTRKDLAEVGSMLSEFALTVIKIMGGVEGDAGVLGDLPEEPAKDLFAASKEALTKTRVFNRLFEEIALRGVDPDDLANASAKQMIHAMSEFYNLNFTGAPGAVRTLVFQVIRSFGGTLMPLNQD